MANEYSIREMTKEEYLQLVCEHFDIPDGELLMNDTGFTTADGQEADEIGKPLPSWFGDLPWDFARETVDAKAADGEADEVYVCIDGSDRLWELPK